MKKESERKTATEIYKREKRTNFEVGGGKNVRAERRKSFEVKREAKEKQQKYILKKQQREQSEVLEHDKMKRDKHENLS